MGQRVLIYVLRRDLRVEDNPIFHEVSKLKDHSQPQFTHFLPIYVFPAQQVEISGFLSSEDQKSPYPEARSDLGNFWRCGHLRSKFLAESVWEVKENLRKIGSGLEIRVGMIGDVVRQVLDGFKAQGGDNQVAAVWMTEEEGVEEKREERAAKKETQSQGIDFKLWKDEKYYVDDDDLPFSDAADLPDVFTSFRKMVEPLRELPRPVLEAPAALLPLPSNIPPQTDPFSIPDSLEGVIKALHKPLSDSLDLENPPQLPSATSLTAHPFGGGSTEALNRLKHLIASGSATSYKKTRNGLLGTDFSTKLSAFLAIGTITARQIHKHLLDFENAKTSLGRDAQGYGQGENEGTAAIRFELLWRDYFRLCTRKFGPRLFRKEGFRNEKNITWKYDAAVLKRWLEGSTGTGLIDASQRELFLTGYTSNRTRQNVASYLAKHLGLDWRFGAEWYECNLIDYDLCSNWGNWQYNSGVGNDPRQDGTGRVFNPVKQASDYDRKAEYIKTWVHEVADVDDPEVCWQYWKLAQSADDVRRRNLEGNPGVESPLVKINFVVGNRGGSGGGRGGGSSRGRRRPSSGTRYGERGQRGRAHGRGGDGAGRNRGRGGQGQSNHDDQAG